MPVAERSGHGGVSPFVLSGPKTRACGRWFAMSEVELVGAFAWPDPAQLVNITLLGVTIFALTCVRTEEVSAYELIVLGLSTALVIK